MNQTALLVTYWVIGAFLSLGATLGWAQPILGTPITGGTGCPSGTVSAVLSPDRNELSVLFDQYTVEASPNRVAQPKSCQVTIPITLPEGEELEVVGADLRGFASVPEGGKAELEVRYLFGDTRHQTPKDKVWVRVEGPKDLDFTASGKPNKRYKTHCRGGTYYLVLRTQMDLNLEDAHESGLITLDSADVYKPDTGRKVKFGYQSARCRGKRGR